MKSTIIISIVACAGLLTACGGGSGGGSVLSGLDNLGGIRQVTGLAPPVETPTEQEARAPGIVSRANSLILSTTYGETGHGGPPNTLYAQCSGATCTLSDAASDVGETVSLDVYQFVANDNVAVGTGHGITLMFDTASDTGLGYARLGAWMNDSFFAVIALESRFRDFSTDASGNLVPGELIRTNALVGKAIGELTGTPLTGSATWLGLMVGTPISGSARGERLLGNAALNYDMAVGEVIDVAFSNIVNIDRHTAHSTSVVQFVDVPLTMRGTFEAGAPGNRVQGGFYGPVHAEASGIFEQSNIVGAFGAKR